MSDQRPPEPGEPEPEYLSTGPGQPAYEPYSAPPAYGPTQPPAYGYGYPTLPSHPQATTALVLGIVALAGGAMCLVPILAGPFAWVIGARARREIDRGQQYGGRDKATAGMVLGIIATALIALAVFVLAVALVVVVAAGA